MEKIVKAIDDNGDLVTQFTEFQMAACNKSLLFSEANLKKAFDFLDFDKDKKIGYKDIAQFHLGQTDTERLAMTEVGASFQMYLAECTIDNGLMETMTAIEFKDF